MGLWQTAGRLDNLEQNYQNMQSSLSDLRSSVSQLNNLPSSIRQLLEEQASLTLSQSVQITALDPVAETATLALSAQPKEYRQDYSALFYALDENGSRTEVPGSYDGTRITGELTLPLTRSIEVYLTLRAPDGTETSQMMDWFSGLQESTTYSFRLPQIPVTMEADSWIGVVFIATDTLGRTSTSGEFFTIQDDMLLFADDTDSIWAKIDAAMGLR